MGLTFAVDQLYATGWSPRPGQPCEMDDRGRPFPDAASVRHEFAGAGRTLELSRSDAFGCVTATWTDDDGSTFAVTGACESEAAVYALSRLRRRLHEPAHA